MSGVFASFAKQLWSEVKTHGPTVRLRSSRLNRPPRFSPSEARADLAPRCFHSARPRRDRRFAWDAW